MESDWRNNRERFGLGGLLRTGPSPWNGYLDFVAELDPPVSFNGILRTHMAAWVPEATTRLVAFGRLITPVGVPDGYFVFEVGFLYPASARFPMGFAVKPDSPV